MNAAEAILEARAVGIHIAVDGDDLTLEASAPPAQAVLDLLSHHKTEIILLLQPAVDGWTIEEWQTFFDERAGIIEFDGRLPRPHAESLAVTCCSSGRPTNSCFMR